jgi:hypothetical protein
MMLAAAVHHHYTTGDGLIFGVVLVVGLGKLLLSSGKK